MKTKNSIFVNHLRRKAAGLSVIEVLISLVIIGICAIGLYAGYAWSFKSIAMTRDDLRATQILIEKAETLRLYSWQQITTNYIPATFTNYYDSVTSQGTKFTGTMTLSATPISASYSNDLKQFAIHIEWTTGKVDRSRDLTTYVARNGIQDYIY